MIDSHCHLEFKHFDKDRERVIEKSKDELKAIVDSSAEIEKSVQVMELHEENPNFIFPSLGLHPEFAVKTSESEIEEYKGYIEDNRERIVSIGEVGLDYYHTRGFDKKQRSKEVFLEFIKLSNSVNLPLVVHSRKSMKDTLDFLREKEGEVVIHCYSGGIDDLEVALDRGYYLSFGGIIFRSRKKYEEILENTPLENLLLETDAPFLGRTKQERSEPWFIREVADKISEIKGVEFQEVWKTACENSVEVFDLPVNCI